MERIRYIQQCLHRNTHSRLNSPSSKHIRYLKQGVSITGLGLDDFMTQVNTLPDIAALFTRAVNEDKIEPNTIVGQQDDITTLNASNRYFTQKKDAQMGRDVQLDRDIDPHGTLTRLLASGFVHTDENIVSYYERVKSGDAGDTK